MAVGLGQTALPLQRLMDCDGVEKYALEMIVQEVDSAGIDSISVVIRPGDDEAYRRAGGKYVDRIKFVIQHQPRGFGDALLAARDFTESQLVL